jgi:hypothetical protein
MAASRVLPSFETLASQAPQDEAGVFFTIEKASAVFQRLLRTHRIGVAAVGFASAFAR